MLHRTAQNSEWPRHFFRPSAHTPMKHSMHIVKSLADKQDAQAIRTRVFVEEQGIPAHLDADGRDAEARHVLIRVGGEAVATGRLWLRTPEEGVLARIAVLPAYRGQGLGLQVVRGLEAEARAAGVESLYLYAHKNLAKFYRKMGYAATGHTTTADRYTLIEMVKGFADRRAPAAQAGGLL